MSAIVTTRDKHATRKRSAGASGQVSFFGIDSAFFGIYCFRYVSSTLFLQFFRHFSVVFLFRFFFGSLSFGVFCFQQFFLSIFFFG